MERSSVRGSPLLDESSSSSDDAEIVGSPKKSKSRASIKKNNSDVILSGSVRSASYNIIFQVTTRVFTFVLNAFVLRYVAHDILGICNVRLALLYSTIMFLSREPFRRVCQRKQETDLWSETINLIWLVVPNTAIWSILLSYVWCYLLTQPGPADSLISKQYQSSVWIICCAIILDSFAEVPYIIGQYFLFPKLRIIGDTTLIAIRSTCLCIAVIYIPSHAILAYALGTLVSVIVVSAIYYGYFYWYIHIKNRSQNPSVSISTKNDYSSSSKTATNSSSAENPLPFTSIREFFPTIEHYKVPPQLARLTWSFFKQGILKQILTEGERYMMTFFDILSFQEQGIYDLVSNLGSLAARFVFLPIEESSYFYFSQTLHRRAQFTSRDTEASRHCAYVLGNLVRLMIIIGSITIVYGLPYSNSVLFLYGGENLSEGGVATRLLQANCVYILIMAVNGITETFTFAAMTQDQLDKYNKKLVIFSGVFLFGSLIFVRLFGSVGFFVANSLNMSLRVSQSVYLIQDVFGRCDFDPFEFWKPKRLILAFFLSAFFILNILHVLFSLGRFVFIFIGLVIFALNCTAIYFHEKELLYFFVDMFRKKNN